MRDAAIQAPTFLFTDIEGSTRLWERSPDVMRRVLVRHDALAQEILGHYGGRIIKSRGEGDSLFALFDTAASGVMAACALQSAFHTEAWAGGWAIRVRMALHRGSAETRDEDFYGPTVNRCARLRAIAHGGQVLISKAVYDAARSELPEDVLLRDMGHHRLKDLQESEQVYQAAHRDVPQEFPALLSLNYVQHNLPVQTTSFVGRENELADIRRILDEHGLLTLVGTGGSGKTRLALQAAVERVDRTVDGVWIVDFASLIDPEHVPQAVVSTLGLREEPNEPVLQTLCAYLKTRTTLLVLDNCEHLLTACADLVETIVRACPKITILATSRERLAVPGEHLYTVPVLPTPPESSFVPGATPIDPASLLQYASVRLFSDRAVLQQPDFALTAGNAESVARICRKLDGIPLALELAAARVRSLSPSQILTRLDDRFHLLTRGSRTALPRQQTLEALIGWSYDLLNETEKTLLHALTVFSGGWTLEAAEEICSNSSEGVPLDVLDTLASLVDKSLVVFTPANETGRYRLLETIRDYAAIRARAAGSDGDTASRHTDYFLKFARDAEPHLHGPAQAEWLERLEAEHDNIRAALARCLQQSGPGDPGPVRQGLELCGALWWFWNVRGHLREGRSWLERALAYNPAPSEERAEALTGLGMLSMQAGDLATAEAAHEEALGIRRAKNHLRGIAVSLTNLGSVALENRQLEQARRFLEECTALWKDLGETDWLARAWNDLGAVARLQGDMASARELYLHGLGHLKAAGDTRNVAILLYNLAEIAIDEQDYSGAEAHLVDCLSGLESVEDKYVQAYAVHLMGRLAYQTGRGHAAARLWGAAHAGFEKIGASLKPEESHELESAKVRLQEQLGDAQFVALWQSGRALPMNAAARLLADSAPR